MAWDKTLTVLIILLLSAAMQRSDFSFDLPENLIAQTPAKERGESRLLCLDRISGVCEDKQFSQLSDLLRPGDLLVFNDTRVVPARLFGRKESGGKIEILLERLQGEQKMLCQMRSSKSAKPATRIILENGAELLVESKEKEFYTLSLCSAGSLLAILEELGHMPLPPYIKREDEALDRERYQTVYSRNPGAVAAPTAGLHFNEDMFAEFEKNGVETAFVTLHVGAGTFQPVRSDTIEDHKMHSEWFSLNESVCQKVTKTRAAGGRVIAVGTTSVRCLESAAAANQRLEPYEGETDIFIYPGYEFKTVDALITNFHLPESTLLMLVSAFVGRDKVLAAYKHAVDESYRFFSYGDAMFIS